MKIHEITYALANAQARLDLDLPPHIGAEETRAIVAELEQVKTVQGLAAIVQRAQGLVDNANAQRIGIARPQPRGQS